MTTRSPRTVQQMHPFMTSMTSSSDFSERIFSSTPTSPNSFSIIAKRKPCVWSSRIWLSSVVFPEPRNPVKIVTGTFLGLHLRFLHSGSPQAGTTSSSSLMLLKSLKKKSTTGEANKRERFSLATQQNVNKMMLISGVKSSVIIY